MYSLSNYITTLKLQIQTESDLTPLLNEGNKIVRIAFNLFKKGYSILEAIKRIQKNYKLNNLFDYSAINGFCMDANSLYKSCVERKQDKLIFGSLKEWKRLHAGLISKKEFTSVRNSKPLLFIGAKADNKCNRKFALDIKNGNVIYKQDRHHHHILKIKTTNSRMKMLEKLQLASEQNLTPITYRINQNHVWITFDETVLKEKEHSFIENIVGSLDLNPNYIAFTIQDFNKADSDIIFKQIFDLTELNNTHDTNKTNYEVLEISKTISLLAKHYRCEIVGLEQLTMPSKNHNKGKRLNRLINNTWKKNLFVNNLKKRLNIFGIKNQEINAAYSSTVGCLDYPTETDSIAAALEIGRRCDVFNKRFIKKQEDFSSMDIMFPIMDRNLIKERWNSILFDYNPKNIGYKGIHEYLKQQKKLNLLRFLFKDYNFSQWSCYRHKSTKSLVDNNFICL